MPLIIVGEDRDDPQKTSSSLLFQFIIIIYVSKRELIAPDYFSYRKTMGRRKKSPLLERYPLEEEGELPIYYFLREPKRLDELDFDI